jgi:hypothetical protein
LVESRTFSTLLCAGFSQPHARTPPVGATVHGVSDNVEADNKAEIAGENIRSRIEIYILWFYEWPLNVISTRLLNMFGVEYYVSQLSSVLADKVSTM